MCLIRFGAPIDIADKSGCTSVHLACRRHHVAIVEFMCTAGCNVNLKDVNGESPLHTTARLGLIALLPPLVANGGNVNILNCNLESPLHLAARRGHLEVIRYLIQANVDFNQINDTGSTAEQLAESEGHDEIVELLQRLRLEKSREHLINELKPIEGGPQRVKLKILGDSSTGKTCLIESLTCGYIKGLIRYSFSSLSSKKVVETPPDHHKSSPVIGTNRSSSHMSTVGIEIGNFTISGAGEYSIWEFSGDPRFYPLYEHFLDDDLAIHVIVVRASDVLDDQLRQAEYWVNLIRYKFCEDEFIRFGGVCRLRPKIIIVASHADRVACPKNVNGMYSSRELGKMVSTLRDKYGHLVDIEENVHVLDSRVSQSKEIKQFKLHLNHIRLQITKNFPPANLLLSVILQALVHWRKSLAKLPVISWKKFVQCVHKHINPVVTVLQLHQIRAYLFLIGEIHSFKCDLLVEAVFLDVAWLSHCLSHLIASATTPVSSPYQLSFDNLSNLFPHVEAWQMLQLFVALDLTRPFPGEKKCYDTPCLLPLGVAPTSVDWDMDPNTTKCNAFRVRPVLNAPLPKGVFAKVLLYLRQLFSSEMFEDSYFDVWCDGAHLQGKAIDVLVLHYHMSHVDIIVKTTASDAVQIHEASELLNDVARLVEALYCDSFCGMAFTREVLSAAELKSGRIDGWCYDPKTLVSTLIRKDTLLLNPRTEVVERFGEVTCFGGIPTTSSGLDMAAEKLDRWAIREVCRLLDRKDPLGLDWCMLAITLNLGEIVPNLHKLRSEGSVSPTSRVLSEWMSGAEQSGKTVAEFITHLQQLGREDAAIVVMEATPLFVISKSIDMQLFSRGDAKFDQSP